MARGNPNWGKKPAAPLGRARTLPPMEKIVPGLPAQPVLVAGVFDRPPETPNPLANSAEPFSFPTGRDLAPPREPYESTTPRLVVEAEIDELLDWGLPRFQARYPRCNADSVRPMLVMALRSSKFRFLRTHLACGLFVAEVTPWEPMLTVQDIFVVAKARRLGEEGNDAPPPLYWGRKEATNIYKAALRWSIEIGAVAFHYGSTTGVDLDPLAAEVGHDVRNVGYTKFITAEMRAALVAA